MNLHPNISIGQKSGWKETEILGIRRVNTISPSGCHLGNNDDASMNEIKVSDGWSLILGYAVF